MVSAHKTMQHNTIATCLKQSVGIQTHGIYILGDTLNLSTSKATEEPPGQNTQTNQPNLLCSYL